jgi:acyl-CoA dehydrogenase
MKDATSTAGTFRLPPDIVELCDLARRVVQKETINLQSVFGNEVLAKLMGIARETGLWYLMVPEQYGGSSLSMLAKVAILEQFYYTAVPFPFANVPNILYECQGAQIDKFLKPVIEGKKTTCFAQTESNAGSDPGGMMQTRAERRGDGWVLNGTKMWISMADESDIIMVQAVTDPAKRQKGGITMFLVERNNPGVHVEVPGIKTWLSQRAAQYIVHFKDCFVPEADVLGEVGQGFNLGQRWLTVHDRLLRGPYALGKMQRALDMSIAWAQQRVTFGKPLAERQAIQWKIVDMYVDLEALRALTYQMAARADAGEDIRAEAAMVKFTSMEWGARCVDHAIQIHGAMGESLELPLTLFYRHLRHGQIGGGANEIQRLQVARKLLKK